jgi:hypothetical protein
VSFSFWSDEDRWFVPRAFGLGYSLNLKYVAKRLGWIKTPVVGSASASDLPPAERAEPKTREARLREQIESSKYEDI